MNRDLYNQYIKEYFDIADSLEREAGDGAYKKVVNLITKMS